MVGAVGAVWAERVVGAVSNGVERGRRARLQDDFGKVDVKSVTGVPLVIYIS